MARAFARAPKTVDQEPLHDAVFQRVKRYGGKTAMRLEHAFGGDEPAFELFKLFIHGNAERLEGAGRGMDALAPTRQNALDNPGELAGTADRTRGDDGMRDGTRALLLAVGFQDARKRRFGERVHQIRGGCSQARIHAHVERAVMTEGKAALGFIELEGRDAEIESDSIGCENAAFGQELF